MRPVDSVHRLIEEGQRLLTPGVHPPDVSHAVVRQSRAELDRLSDAFEHCRGLSWTVKMYPFTLVQSDLKLRGCVSRTTTRSITVLDLGDPTISEASRSGKLMTPWDALCAVTVDVHHITQMAGTPVGGLIYVEFVGEWADGSAWLGAANLPAPVDWVPLARAWGSVQALAAGLKELVERVHAYEEPYCRCETGCYCDPDDD